MNEIEQIIVQIVEESESKNDLVTLEYYLQHIEDVERLQELASKYTPHTEVTVPLYKKILEIRPDDIDAIASLGFLYWLDGKDDDAREQMELAKTIDALHIGTLTLEAALSEDSGVKIELYRIILEKEPTNRVALENLRLLNSPCKSQSL